MSPPSSLALPASDPVDALLSLPPPRMGPDQLAQVLVQGWGLTGRLSPLTSERDLNHRLGTAKGRFVVKLSNPAEPAGMTEFQTRALLHLAQFDPGLPVPRVVACNDGALWRDLPQGRLRVLTWLEGTPLAQSPVSDAQAQATGAALARLSRALASYDPPGADPVILWDIQQMPRLAALMPSLPDPDLRADLDARLANFDSRVAPVLSRLPRQVCHADFNPHNLLADAADPDLIAGILDFGDMVRAPRICDLAVAASYLIDPARPLGRVVALLQGYGAHLTPDRTEVALLFDLIVARMVTTLAITGWRAARYPDNAPYILRNAPSARAGLQALGALGRDAATRAFADAFGMGTLP